MHRLGRLVNLRKASVFVERGNIEETVFVLKPSVYLQASNVDFWTFWILTAVTSTIMTFVLVPLLVGVALISWVIRLFVVKVARIRYPGIIKPFTDRGIYSVASGERAQLNSLFFLVCSQRVSLLGIQGHFRKRFLLPDNEDSKKYENLRHRWRKFMGFLFWEKNPDFKLENHIRMYDYTDSGAEIGRNPTEDYLRAVTNGLVAKEYARGQSPWELLLIENFHYSGKGCTEGETTVVGSVLALRMHHALADWQSIIKFLQHLCQTDRDDDVRYTITEAKFPRVGRLEKLATNLMTCARLPTEISSAYVEQHCMGEKFSWLPFRRQLRLQNYHTFLSDRIPLETIKILRRKFGVSSNAVLNTVITGALVKLLEQNGRGMIPRSLLCSYSVPLPKHPGGLVNHHTFGLFTISPRKRSSAKERLREISRVVKTSALAINASASMYFRANALMCTVMPLKLIELVASMQAIFPVYITNVPGPNQEMNLLDKDTRIVDILATLGHPVSYMGFSATAVSNAGGLRIVLNVDRDVLTEPSDDKGYYFKSFAQFLHNELEELLD